MKLPSFMAVREAHAQPPFSPSTPSSARNEAPTGPASAAFSSELDRLRSLTIGLAQAAGATSEAIEDITGRFAKVLRLAGTNPAIDEAGRVVNILQSIPNLHPDLRVELEADLRAAVFRSCGLFTINTEIPPCVGERYRDALAPHESEDF